MLRGDGPAWQSFVQEYAPLIRSRVVDVAFSYRRGHDWSTIDDVTAEVFSTLLSSDSAPLRAFQGRSSLSTYLAVIATRVATRVLIRLNRTSPPTEFADTQLICDPAHSETHSDRLMGQEEREQLLRLVNQLPERQRKIVELFYREGRTYTQISERLGIPLGSIGPTLRRAEAKLRGWIEDD